MLCLLPWRILVGIIISRITSLWPLLSSVCRSVMIKRAGSYTSMLIGALVILYCLWPTHIIYTPLTNVICNSLGLCKHRFLCLLFFSSFIFAPVAPKSSFDVRWKPKKDICPTLCPWTYVRYVGHIMSAKHLTMKAHMSFSLNRLCKANIF